MIGRSKWRNKDDRQVLVPGGPVAFVVLVQVSFSFLLFLLVMDSFPSLVSLVSLPAMGSSYSGVWSMGMGFSSSCASQL